METQAIFLTLNSSRLQAFPTFLPCVNVVLLNFFYKYQPYLAFVPRENVFEGPIFGRFHGNRSFFESKVVAVAGSFVFDTALAQSWICVEDALIMLMGQFHISLKPMNAPHDSYPSDTKFYEHKPTLKKVVDSVLFAQKLFLQLIAELRYSIAMSTKLQS